MELHEIQKVKEAMDLLLRDDYDNEQILIILDGCENRLSAEEISLFANPAFSTRQMNVIKRALIDRKAPVEVIRKYADPKRDALLLGFIFDDYSHGLFTDEIDEYDKFYDTEYFYRLQRTTVLNKSLHYQNPDRKKMEMKKEITLIKFN